MDTLQTIQFITGSGGIFGILYLIFKMGRFTQKLDNFIVATGQRFEKVDKQFEKVDNQMDIQSKKIEQQFEKVDRQFEKINTELKEIRKDLSEVKERISVAEAENFLIHTIPNESTKSEIAKKVWKRRKMHQALKLEKKGE